MIKNNLICSIFLNFILFGIFRIFHIFVCEIYYNLIFDDLEINNNMKLKKLCDNKTLIRENTKTMYYTLFF